MLSLVFLTPGLDVLRCSVSLCIRALLNRDVTTAHRSDLNSWARHVSDNAQLFCLYISRQRGKCEIVLLWFLTEVTERHRCKV